MQKPENIQAWEQLLTQDLTSDELRDLIERVGTRKIATEFLKRDDMRYLPEYTNILQQAGERLINGKPSNTDLCYLIRYTQYNEWALNELFKRNPTNYELGWLIQFTPYKDGAAKLLLSQSPSNGHLCDILDHTEFKEEAAEAIFRQHPDYDDLLCLMRYSEYKDKAWELFVELDPDVDKISYVIEHRDLVPQATALLRERIGCEIVDEEGLMKEIARAILAQPEGFEMCNWYRLVPEISALAKELTQKYNIVVAYCAVVPHYYNYYENASPEEWLEKLKELANK